MRTEDCHVRPMRAADLAPAQGVVAAFGAAPAEPPDRTAPPRFPVPFLASRFAREPEGCFVALRGDGGVVGAVYSATRGSMGWLGPLAVAPWAQRQSIGRQLLEACLRRWATLGVALAGLEIDAADTGQHRLFGGAGFRADWLSVGLRRAAVGHGAAPPGSARVVPFSSLVPKERQARLAQVRALGERLYPGLDWTRELGLVFQLGLGESWLIDEAGVAVGLAVAHAWPQAETREGELRLKLLALDPERGTAAQFHALLDTLEAEAVARGLDAIATRVCTRARGGYWTLLAERGYALCEPKVRMKRGAHPDYEPTDGYYFDDWL